MRGFVVLLAVVLAAIGVGIGIEAATQPARYGPPGGEFTAAFPAPPTTTSQKSRPPIFSTFDYAARGPSSQLTVTVTVISGSGWTGYAPLTRRFGNVQAFALTTGGAPPRPRPLSLHSATLQGERVEVGVSCPAPASCGAALFGLDRRVDGHPVQWSATAFARSRTLAWALVTSLRPVDGAPLPAR